MNPHDAFESILASLHRATFDGDHWPAVSALIDDACGMVGNSLAVGEGFGDHAARVRFVGMYRRGERRQDLEREYFEGYYAHDPRVPRLWRAPDRKLVYVPDLYTEAERRASPVYNEGLSRLGSQNGLNVRFKGPDGLRIVWATGDPMASGGWQSVQIELIESLLPHIRHFVLVRQALAADAVSVDLADLLDNTRIGVLHLDRGGRVLAANAPAADILRRGEGLLDRGGTLHAWLPEENDRLQKLLGRALPVFGSDPPTGGSLTLRRPSGKVLLLHVSPVGGGEGDFGARRVAALVLAVDPASRPRVDPARLSEAFGLTASEGRVTALLAEGRPVHEIAWLTDLQPGYVRLLLKRVYKKQGVSGQVALVPRVLAVGALPRR